MINWLKKRLSGSQKNSDRYVALAEALEEYWEDHFDPFLQELIDTRSIYTASDADLKRKIAELGDRFSPDYPTEYDKPLSLAWRRYEIKRKGTEYLLKNSFKRNFGNLRVEWVSLWASKAKEYGTEFKIEADLTALERKALFFLTSRGQISVDLGHIRSLGMDKQTFLGHAENIIQKAKPAHIVYDGPIFYINLPIEFTNTVSCNSEIQKRLPIQVMDRRLDDHNLDTFALDTGNMDFRKETIVNVDLAWEEAPKRLDNFASLDDVPLDFMPLDMCFSEG